MKKTLALLLAVLMTVSVLSCGLTAAAETDSVYTYNDSVSTLASNWNPHTYQTNDDSYPADFLRVGLYSFIFNDELNPVEGKDPYTGYVIVPEMAAEMPVDITEQVKAEHPNFNIPESATAGYAYSIKLNPDACWEDGTPINADTYVESMERLLRAELMNYRATDYYAGSLCIAGAEAYAKSGSTTYEDNCPDGDDSNFVYAMDVLTKDENGQYVSPKGEKMFIGLNVGLAWTGGDTLKDYVEAYGEGYFDVTNWDALVAMMDDNGVIPATDENIELFTPVIAGNPAWGESADNVPCYMTYEVSYADASFEDVGCYKLGDYEIALVFGKSLAGFQLLYNLSSNWIVKTDLYDTCLSETDGVWTSTYNSDVATTVSYGPYKMVSYQTGKAMRFEKNENWYGYTDGKHVYVDPEDGETYDMYMTDVIDTQVVEEASTRKLMFLKGELMTYGLQADDFATYRNSEFCHVVPGSTLFFLILNGHQESIANREKAEDFDNATTDLETMTLNSFRRAVAVVYDRELFAATVSPARSGGYGIIGTQYIYDPETCAFYRDTEAAKQVLCDFYSVDVSKYDSLDDAVASITGYDPETAKVLFNQAFEEAIAAGYITDTDGDGKSDQTVTIEYCISSDSDFMTKTVNYLNEKMTEVTAGTPFEGKILFTKSQPYGNDWSNKIKEGLADTVLGGWSGSLMDPYGLTDLYVNPSYQYDGAWFDATTVSLTMTVDGEEITMNLRQWSDALNGATVEVGGKGYCFGDGIADMETRVAILAAIEGEVLKTYNYLPMLQDGGMTLLTQKAFYVVEDYNPVLGRGGITYLKYNYSDAEWTAYVAEQGGELQY